MADCVSENMNIINGQGANGLGRYPMQPCHPPQACCPSLIAGPTGPTGPAGATGAVIYPPAHETR